MSENEHRAVAFDSNILTYFLEGNRGSYELVRGDRLAEQRIAAVRLFLYCSPIIVPTVRAETLRIGDAKNLEEHMRFIDGQFAEFRPYSWQRNSIENRTRDLLPYHPKGE